MCILLKHACKTWPKLAYLENVYGRRIPFQQTLICYTSTIIVHTSIGQMLSTLPIHVSSKESLSTWN
jgi:hypothetical protein